MWVLIFIYSIRNGEIKRFYKILRNYDCLNLLFFLQKVWWRSRSKITEDAERGQRHNLNPSVIMSCSHCCGRNHWPGRHFHCRVPLVVYQGRINVWMHQQQFWTGSTFLWTSDNIYQSKYVHFNIFLNDNNKISCTITSIVVPDPDPYWECGPRPRSMNIDQNLQINLVSWLSERLLYLHNRTYVFWPITYLKYIFM